MGYNIKDPNGGSDGAHAITKEVIIILDKKINLDQASLQGIYFVLGLIILYILLVLWSFYRDNKKQVFAPHLQGKELHISQSKTDGLQAVNLDYTAETLEMTSVNTDDLRDYSNIMVSTTGEPSPNARTPQSSTKRQRSFDFSRSRRRRSNNRSPSPHTPTRSAQEIPPSSIDLSDISRHASSHDHDRSTVSAQPENDQSIFRRGETKRNSGKPPTALIKRRQTIGSKLCKLLHQRHIIWSTIKKMSQTSPRWKRVGQIYFLINLNLFLMSIAYINKSIQDSPVGISLLNISIAWIIFGIIAKISSVSKDKIKDTVTTEDFQKALFNLQQESKAKNIFLHFIIFAFCLFAYCQYALFITFFESKYADWVIASSVAFCVQMFGDALWLFLMSMLYRKAYTSRKLRRMYRFFNTLRFWTI